MTRKPDFRKKKIPRARMESAIQAHLMEQHKWFLSERRRHDVGKAAYFDWVEKYGQHCRRWLESLSDEEIEKEYNKIQDYLKRRFELDEASSFLDRHEKGLKEQQDDR